MLKNLQKDGEAMTIKTETLPIPQLCEKLGINEISIDASVMCKEWLWINFRASHGGVSGRVVLKINDLFPTDICETCGHEKKAHTECGCEPCLISNLFRCGNVDLAEKKVQDGKVCLKFKPKLARVVGIKLVERCECGKSHDHEKKDASCDDCPCKQYRPVQEVEITTEG